VIITYERPRVVKRNFSYDSSEDENDVTSKEKVKPLLM
jgi:hypothetical protein